MAQVVKVVLREPGDIVGDVTANGVAIEGAVVSLRSAATCKLIATVTTAEDGSYRFDAAAAGNYRIHIRVPGGRKVRRAWRR